MRDAAAIRQQLFELFLRGPYYSELLPLVTIIAKPLVQLLTPHAVVCSEKSRLASW